MTEANARGVSAAKEAVFATARSRWDVGIAESWALAPNAKTRTNAHIELACFIAYPPSLKPDPISNLTENGGMCLLKTRDVVIQLLCPSPPYSRSFAQEMFPVRLAFRSHPDSEAASNLFSNELSGGSGSAGVSPALLLQTPGKFTTRTPPLRSPLSVLRCSRELFARIRNKPARDSACPATAPARTSSSRYSLENGQNPLPFTRHSRTNGNTPKLLQTNDRHPRYSTLLCALRVAIPRSQRRLFCLSL